MLKKPITVAVFSAFVLAAAAPSFAQNTQNQSGGNSDQMTPGVAPSDNSAQKPQKSKKKREGAIAGAQTGDKDTHPGNPIRSAYRARSLARRWGLNREPIRQERRPLRSRTPGPRANARQA